MLIIASNITTRNARVARIFRQGLEGSDTGGPVNCPGLKDIAEACISAGADILEINLQQRYDRPEMMEFAVNAVQQVTDRQLCLSSNSAAALEAGLKACRRPPLVNYVSIDLQRLQEILPLVSRYQAEVILLVSDPAAPLDARLMLEKAAVLVGAANNEGIPNERILLDPGLFHITAEPGQRHLVEVMEFLRSVSAAFDASLRTTAWLGNTSAGAPERLRPLIETSLLFLFAGLGISSVFLDILRRENKRAVRLLQIIHNQQVYADGLLEL